MAAPKFGTLVPNRIFVGGISASTSEAELAQLFSAYGNVKATKIIADRGGVSKGYGFVTFETEEEAKRLQQESESIILRERKLNIAPAIKKQPFNRSFDGAGSPPAMAANAYYYPNGMGLPYQNSMAFYNPGPPGPGAPMVPPTDPTSLYQASGMFGPAASPGPPAFAPIMYPMPATSLYMPQQYQYPPVPTFEPYYPGAVGNGAAPPYLYGGPHQASPGPIGPIGGNIGGNGVVGGGGSSASNGAGGGGSSSGSITAGTTSPAGGSGGGGTVGPGQFGTHFYGPITHHPLNNGPQQSPSHLDHLYYPYSAQSQAPPASSASLSSNSTQPGHQQQHQLGISATDQLQLVYSGDVIGQPSGGNDLQANQSEETRSTSSLTEQPHQQASSNNNGGPQSSDPSGSTPVPLLPLKHPLSNRYPNYPPAVLHVQQLEQHHQQTSSNDASVKQHRQSSASEDATIGPGHYRPVSVYSGPLYMCPPPGGSANPNAGPSLLPTPPQPPFDLSSSGHPKYREYGSKPFVKPAPPLPGQPHHNPSAYARHYSGQALSQQQPQQSHHQAKRGLPPGVYQHPTHHLSGSPAYYFPPKQSGSRPGQQQPFLSSYMAPTRNHPSHEHYIAAGNGRRSAGSDLTQSLHSQPQPLNPDVRHSGRGRQLGASGAKSALAVAGNPSSNSGTESAKSAIDECTSSKAEIMSSKSAGETDSSEDTNHTDLSTKSTNMTIATKNNPNHSSEDCHNPATSSSAVPATRPYPSVSSSPNHPNQVQFFGSSSQRYGNTSSGLQQQRGARYSSYGSRGGSNKGSGFIRQQSGSGGSSKYKMNGFVQSSNGKISNDDLGGAGDAPPVGRMPLTPPTTPQQSVGASDSQGQQLNDACHQMQTLSL
ncbi:hypothetical protein QAD02_016006 [Eretmocerus hayati]|uniref:Uncharacterized protein n=1 Tax=Eretmocerus hayati TaxID=131215 RepID=A0ACC2PA92_9HYME|nr:hypothetical protein QAD02_016006 [Eretmocerus hayati]